jgi:glycine/D-amino acid oxidase-like deaminating enzyme
MIFAGATVEDVGFRKATTARALAGLRRMASALVPVLGVAEVASTWAGLRPGSPDGLPVIGRFPGKDNVYLATGHFRNGVLLAPITGSLVADLVLTGRADRRLRPFSPRRFV